MTSTVRISEIKNGKADTRKNRDGKPREGSRLRAIYDLLRTGQVVNLKGLFAGESANQLRDFYGMDIQAVRDDRGRVIGSRLVGEWDGPYYVPIERIVTLTENA